MSDDAVEAAIEAAQWWYDRALSWRQLCDPKIEQMLREQPPFNAELRKIAEEAERRGRLWWMRWTAWRSWRSKLGRSNARKKR